MIKDIIIRGQIMIRQHGDELSSKYTSGLRSLRTNISDPLKLSKQWALGNLNAAIAGAGTGGARSSLPRPPPHAS